MRIVHRNFPELRNVENERIHFSMFVKRHATGQSNATPVRSRISPDIWESFFQEINVYSPEQGITVLFIDVDRPPKKSWSKRLHLAKERTGKLGNSLEDDPVGPELPAYTTV